ncbi:hypothetical protein BMU55_003953 [Escherichia coli]|nr:hypothetical protein [Escherichia coli]
MLYPPACYPLQRKIVTEGDKSSVVNNPTGRKRPAEK